MITHIKNNKNGYVSPNFNKMSTNMPTNNPYADEANIKKKLDFSDVNYSEKNKYLVEKQLVLDNSIKIPQLTNTKNSKTYMGD